MPKKPKSKGWKKEKNGQQIRGRMQCTVTAVELATQAAPRALKKRDWSSQWSRTDLRWVRGMITEDRGISGDERDPPLLFFFQDQVPKKKAKKGAKRGSKTVFRVIFHCRLTLGPNYPAVGTSRADKVGALARRVSIPRPPPHCWYGVLRARHWFISSVVCPSRMAGSRRRSGRPCYGRRPGVCGREWLDAH